MNFGSYSSDSFDLVLASRVIGSPKAKVSKVSVPGSDLTLDFTEAFGGVHYENRTITLTFLSLEPWDDSVANDQRLKNAIHGQKLHIVFDDDPDYYWIGRINVGDWTYYKGASKVQVTIDCEPYKYKARETTKSVTTSSSGSVTLKNGRMPVVPTVSTNAEVTLAWTGYSVTISAGNNQVIPQLVLEEGSTTITITGSATVSFKYREGSL